MIYMYCRAIGLSSKFSKILSNAKLNKLNGHNIFESTPSPITARQKYFRILFRVPGNIKKSRAADSEFSNLFLEYLNEN